MVTAPFTTGLRLNLEVGHPSSARAVSDVESWRDRLRYVAQREPTCRRFAPDVAPSAQQAAELLTQTFATHPMVNVARDAGEPAPGPGAAGVAYVIAEIALLPDFAPITPGTEFPDVTEDVVGSPVLVHVAPWPYRAHSDEEHEAAELLLQEVVSSLPPELWRNDG